MLRRHAGEDRKFDVDQLAEFPAGITDAELGELLEHFLPSGYEINDGGQGVVRVRRFFICQALLNGATEGEVREWVGHTDSKLIEHYRTLHAEDARRRMQSLDLLGEQRAEAEAEATTDGEADRDVA